MFREIAGNRVDLLAINPSHTEDLFACASDQETTKFMPWPPHTSIEQTSAFVEETIEGYAARAAYYWAIFHKSDRRVIGICGFPKYSWPRDHAEVGYLITRDYWHQGLGSEIVQMLIEFGFHVLQLATLKAYCEINNIASKRLIEKSAFQPAGIVDYPQQKHPDKPTRAKKYILQRSRYREIQQSRQTCHARSTHFAGMPPSGKKGKQRKR
jgi:[ribosomal protein S5]-alanine N-acetyltransferase